MQRFESSSVAIDSATELPRQTAHDGELENDVVPVVEEQDATLAAAAGVEKAGGANRLVALDLMRGLIMIIMSWDHTKDIFADAAWSPKHSGREGWNGPFASYDNNWWWFIARAVSNVCAPGFFLTMGMSMSLFTIARAGQGWGAAAIAKHFAVRSIVLLAVGRLVDAPFMLAVIVRVFKGDTVPTWNGSYGPGNKLAAVRDAFIGIFEVMTGLGLTMLTALVVLGPLYWLYKREASKDDNETEWTQSAREALLPRATRDNVDQAESGETEGRANAGWLARAAWHSLTKAEIASYFVFATVYAVSNIVVVTAQGDSFFLDKNATQAVFPDFNAHATSVGETLARFFVIPGLLPAPFGAASYPVFPWLALTSLGIGIGFSLKRNTADTINRLGLMSVAFLCSFVLVRHFGGKFGNYRGLPRGDGQRAEDEVHVDKLLAFFIMSKYPPSLSFAFFYVGIDLSFVFAFFQSMDWFPLASQHGTRGVTGILRRAADGFWHLCLALGQVPLFFYILHFWVLGPASAVAAAFTDDYKVSLPACVGMWVCLLALLWPACVRYGAFKRTTARDSVWRLL